MPDDLVEGDQQLRTFVILPTFNLGVVGGELLIISLGEQTHGLLLGFRVQAASALLVGQDPTVRDVDLNGVW